MQQLKILTCFFLFLVIICLVTCDDFADQNSSSIPAEDSRTTTFTDLPSEVECLIPDDFNGVIFSREDAFNYKDRVIFTCGPGRPIFISYCLRNGSWSEPLECSAISCGYPGDVENSQRIGDNFIFPNNVTYQCKSGYIMKGRSVRSCLASGTWSSALPSCEPRSCGYPGDVENAHRVGEKFTFPSNVTYKCDTGYTMKGRSVRYCSQSGSWAPALPSCEPISCAYPGDVENAQRIGDNFAFRSTVSYKCNRGYKMKGRSVLHCFSAGFWVPSLPSCEPISCGYPGDVENSQRIGDNFTFPNNVTYQCKSGYIMKGRSVRSCLASGTWSSALPSCEPRSCGYPGDVENAQRVGEKFTFPNNVSYKCDTDYRMKGCSVRYCSQSGSWAPALPSCEPISCVYPGDVKNAERIGDNFTFRSSVTYKCNRGYKMKGRSVLHCFSGGFWVPSLPSCERVTCPYPDVQQYGRIMNKKKNIYHYDDIVLFYCLTGYEVCISQCLENGRWSHKGPIYPGTPEDEP